MILRNTTLCAGLTLLLALLFILPVHADGNEQPLSAKDLETLISKGHGRVVVINFWASWCGPCRHEFPAMAKLRNQFPADKLLVLGVSLDFDQQMYSEFVAAQGFPYPVKLGDSRIMNDMGIEAIPKTLIFDMDGNLIHNHDGPAPFAELNAAVRALLRKGHTPENTQ